MNPYQMNFNEKAETDQLNFNKSEKFQDAVNDMRLLMWKKFLLGVANNPYMTKKEVCYHLGLKVGTINSIQQHYKLSSPFYYKKPKAHSKKKKENNAVDPVAPVEDSKKSKKKPPQAKSESLKGGATYDFDETFDSALESARS